MYETECRHVAVQQFREIIRTRTIYSTETHTSDFTSTENTETIRTINGLGAQDVHLDFHAAPKL